MTFCENVTRPALEVPLEALSLLKCLECDIQFDLPRNELGSVWTFSGIMIGESLAKVCRVSSVLLVNMAQALDYVRIEHGLPSKAWNQLREKSSFAKPMEDILRLKPSRCSGFQAKDGGGRRVTLPLQPACRAGASLFCHAPCFDL